MPKLKAKLPLFGLTAAFVLFLILSPGACLARNLNEDCGSVFCGNLTISYPFRLKTQPRNCGYHSLELDCEKNNRATRVMKHGKFSVQEIFYENSTMRIVDASLDRDDCNSLPLGSIYSSYSDRPCGYPFFLFYAPDIHQSIMYLVNCTKPTKSSLYVDASRCTTKSNSSSPPSSYFYFLDQYTQLSDFDQSCTVVAEVPITADNISGMSTLDIYMKLSNGILLSWEIYNFSCNYNFKLSFRDVLHNLEYGLSKYWASFANFFLNRQAYYVNSRTYILCLGITGTPTDKEVKDVKDFSSKFHSNTRLC